MRTRLRSLGAATLVGVLLVVGGTAAPAAAATPRVKPCIRPDGVNVQEFAHISVSVVAPWYPGCGEIKAGTRWTTGMGWFAAKTWQAIPAGYVPAASTPIADFQSKLVSAKVVVDAGTSTELTVVWPNSSALLLYSDAQYDYASAITLGTVRALPVGTHTLQRFIELRDVTCDGTSSDPHASCAPAGEIAYDDPNQPLVFTVVK